MHGTRIYSESLHTSTSIMVDVNMFSQTTHIDFAEIMCDRCQLRPFHECCDPGDDEFTESDQFSFVLQSACGISEPTPKRHPSSV